MSQPVARPDAAPKQRAAGLYTIIAIKLGKSLLLLALAVGFFSLVGKDLDVQFDHFLRWIHVDPSTKFFEALGQKLSQITPGSVKFVAIGLLLYSVLLAVESTGLILRSWWAAWLAIGETAFFIPLEVYELVRRPSVKILVLMVINVAIVAYLVRNRQRLFRQHHPQPVEEPESP